MNRRNFLTLLTGIGIASLLPAAAKPLGTMEILSNGELPTGLVKGLKYHVYDQQPSPYHGIRMIDCKFKTVEGYDIHSFRIRSSK